MVIINRIALIIFFLLTFPILLILSIINVNFVVVYLMWMLDLINKFLYGSKETI
jgi:hypothetical protein